jgi:hypothetical protein
MSVTRPVWWKDRTLFLYDQDSDNDVYSHQKLVKFYMSIGMTLEDSIDIVDFESCFYIIKMEDI